MPSWGQGFGRFKLKSGWTKRLDRDIERLQRNAVREWLRAILVRVPVWSGQARGSIKFATGQGGFLAAYLNTAVQIDPRHETRTKNQYTGPGNYSFEVQQHRYIFKFSTDVIHYHYNEFLPRTDSGAGNQQVLAPWLSMQYGERAWRLFVRQEFKSKRFFKIRKYILWGNLTNRVTGVTTDSVTEAIGA